jgi:hypothetical protein
LAGGLAGEAIPCSTSAAFASAVLDLVALFMVQYMMLAGSFAVCVKAGTLSFFSPFDRECARLGVRRMRTVTICA